MRGRVCLPDPLSHGLRRASSPERGSFLPSAVNFATTAKTSPLRGRWHRAAMTERVQPSPRKFSFTFVLVFPVYRISAKGARAENPHGIRGSCVSFTIVLYFVSAWRTFVCFVLSGGVQGPYLCAKMLLFSAWENRYTTATESNRRTAKTAVLRNRCITGKGEVHYGTSI